MLHNMRVLVVGEHFFIISKMNKKSCFKSRHFINIHIINRTLHGRLAIRILSPRAESISHSFASLTRERYFQHSKIKFVSRRGHVISSISCADIFLLFRFSKQTWRRITCVKTNNCYSNLTFANTLRIFHLGHLVTYGPSAHNSMGLNEFEVKI